MIILEENIYLSLYKYSLNINLFSGDFSLYSGLDFGFLISSKLLHSPSLDQDKIDKLKYFLSHCGCRCSGKTSGDKNARYFYRSLANKDKKSKIEDQDIYSLFGIKYIVGMKIPLFLGFYFALEFKDSLKPFISQFFFKSSRESSTLSVILGLNINKFIEIF
jgi:hypothetical protein